MKRNIENAAEEPNSSAAVLRLADYGRMTIDVEFLLAGHPFLFLGWKCVVEGFHSGGVLAAIGGGTENVQPLSAVQRTGDKLTNQKRWWEVSGIKPLTS